MEKSTKSLLSLPNEIIDKILSFLPCDEISGFRLVCQQLNKTCGCFLNRDFARANRIHSRMQREVKSQLPRRESERRTHPLSRHVDILAAVETRLSLLNMTYMKYIDADACCFIPGKVLDEIFRILRYIRSTLDPLRSHEIMQELRDISSMAMEHFEEKIVPLFRTRMSRSGADVPSTSAATAPAIQFFSASSGQSGLAASSTRNVSLLRNELGSFRHGMSALNVTLAKLTKEAARSQARAKAQSTKMAENERKLLEHEATIRRHEKRATEQGSKIIQQEHLLNELVKKLSDVDQKIKDLTGEIALIRSSGICGKDLSVARDLGEGFKAGGVEHQEKGSSKDSLSTAVSGKIGKRAGKMEVKGERAKEELRKNVRGKIAKRESRVRELDGSGRDVAKKNSAKKGKSGNSGNDKAEMCSRITRASSKKGITEVKDCDEIAASSKRKEFSVTEVSRKRQRI